VENDPTILFDALGLDVTADGHGVNANEANRFGNEFAKFKGTPTGNAFYNCVKKANVVIKFDPNQRATGNTSVNSHGGTITFRPGMANIDDIAHEFQHAAVGLPPVFDPPAMRVLVGFRGLGWW
jgi:hypothetical protein